jgi:secretory carrier-associated membrane protein
MEKGYATNNGFTMSAGKTQRELELDAREAQLNFRENKVKEQEAKMAKYGWHPPNWPPFRPVLYHDIEEEIPGPGKRIVWHMYYYWLYTLVLYFVNVWGCLMQLSFKVGGGGTSFGLSILFMVIGPLFGWTFWYRNLYNGVKRDNSLEYVMYFLGYFIHLCAVLLFALGLPNSGGRWVSGLLVCVNLIFLSTLNKSQRKLTLTIDKHTVDSSQAWT